VTLEIHQSTMSLMSKCPQAVEHYLNGLKRPPLVVLLMGTVTHRVGEANLGHKMEHGELLGDADVMDLAASIFRDEWDGGEPLLTEEERQLGKSRVKGATKDACVNLGLMHSKRIAPSIEPVALERAMTLLVDGERYRLVGTLDVEEEDRIRDLKTSVSRMTIDDARDSVQLDMYAFMLERLTGKRVSRVCLDVLQKAVIPKPYTLDVAAPSDFEPLLMRIERTAKVIESGAFMPVDPSGPSGWICSERFCGYFDDCVFGRRRRKAL